MFGARPLRRYIQRELETRIARALLAGEIHEGARVRLVAGPDGLDIATENPEEEGAPTEAEPEAVGAAA